MIFLQFLSLLFIIGVVYSQQEEQSVRIFVNNISPFDNPTETYRYYMLPFCEPDTTYQETQSLGESLSGDRKMNSIYEIQQMNKNITTVEICSKKYEQHDLKMFQNAIEEDFIAEFYIEDIATHDIIGVLTDEGDYVLKTHINFNIYVDSYQNILHANITLPEDNDFTDINIDEDEEFLEIPFYYSVKFIEIDKDDVKFFDYLETPEIEENEQNNDIHWLFIINSFILIFMLVLLVSYILQKTIRKDVSISKDLENDNDDVGWKMIRTEALLPPTNKLLLSSFIGTGIQFLYLCLGLSLLGAMGLYYGHHKGNQKTFGILIFAFTGVFNGFYSSKYYKFMGGKHWAITILTSCLLFPLVVFGIWSIINSIAWYNDSTAAIPFKSVFFIICMWLLIYVPLTVLGGISGRMKNLENAPNPDTSLPRLYKPLPPKKIYQHPIFQFIAAGLLPFSSIYLELYYIVMSVWGHHQYHLYTILFIALIILLLVHICVSITMTYFQLNSQDYNWWWRSFINGGSISIFFMLYSLYFYFEKSHMHGLIQGSFYYGYTILFSFALFLMMGSISFLVSNKFVRYIYSKSKVI